ncbi:MAG: polyprenyl synthetase family protein [Parvularculaceae bacterium]|nr:polyprenyl synthetase family protein [Parvularculaceae bacterium]
MAVGALRTLTGEDLKKVDQEITHSARSSVGLIPELAGHLAAAGGKRVRPMLTLAAARACGYCGEDHVKLAAAVELIHGATLLHDDVVDGSLLRRGLKTANVIWGNKESVLVGDFIFSRAFELMVAARNLKVLQILSAASGVIAEGEVLQLATQNNLSVTFDTYLAVIESKTAALFAAATHAGAAIAEAPAGVELAFKHYGRELGIAYQLIDDALDYSGFEASLGKRTGDDFREGKMTLPIVYALERADAEERKFWKRTISDGVQRSEDFEEACAILARTNALGDSIACARRYARRAIDELSAAPDNEFTQALVWLAETSVQRVS